MFNLYPFGQRRFTLEEAQKIVPDLMRIAGRCREEMEHLWSTIRQDCPEEQIKDAHLRLNAVKGRWYRDVALLGAIPRRLWEVSFDTGEGYFLSWRIGEDDISHFYTEDTGKYIIRRSIGWR